MCSETDLAQQETEGAVFSSTQYGIVPGGGSCGRALAHLTCLQMAQCEELTVVRNLLSAKHWALQILCGGTKLRRQPLKGSKGGRGDSGVAHEDLGSQENGTRTGMKKSLQPVPALLLASASQPCKLCCGYRDGRSRACKEKWTTNRDLFGFCFLKSLCFTVPT